MSRKCELTGKKPMVGNNVPFSQKKTKRRQLPNIQKKRIYVPELGKLVTLKVSTKAIKIIDKKGLMPYLREKGLTIKDVT